MTLKTERPGVDAAAFREALGAVCAPVAVVTSLHEGRPHGATVSAFCSLSLEPPLVLVALDRGSDLLAMVRQAGRYGINVLSHGQAELATHFARKGVDKFADVPWDIDTDLPRLRETASWIACRLHEVVDGGDHVIAVGFVEHAQAASAHPLLYRQREFGTLAGRLAVNPHLTTETVTAGNPDATVAAVLVHGRDQDPDFMLEVAGRIALDDSVAYVLPRAADRSWYPGRFHDPTLDNEPWLSWSLDAIDAAVALARGPLRPLTRVALVGFSQGACIVAERVARRPEPYGAAAVLTGALFGEPDAERLPAGSLGGLPMFFGIPEDDDWIPVSAVRKTVAAFQRAGARCDLRIYGPGEHGVNDDEAAAVRGLLTDLLELAS
jgi:flavin reductase (DIM6/NTAB) family NADH-FMN oxidoreductase RutF/dienelactone hydrolase